MYTFLTYTYTYTYVEYKKDKISKEKPYGTYLHAWTGGEGAMADLQSYVGAWEKN